MTQKFQRFGKYLILDHLVDGGMAKICRARFLGEQANKVVAIKMVQPQFCKDPSFVQMFQDELNVTFSLQHPNIVQVYDYGKISDQLYTAMEYVDGVNLKQVLDRLKEKNVVFPVEISVYIISQVCQGLYYAHTFTDKLTGRPLSIIHRDISPHNIMITYDGAVKVIDFGIAKANTNSEATQAGTIKGKLSYLAPEYLEGMELDSRYDMFAVGITLWELLCSRKLFTANNDLAVLKLIQACKIQPPSSINPNVPKELDEIVMKALSKDRNDRFENMDKFNRALVKFLYSHYPDFNPSDLSYFSKELFREEIKRDKEKFYIYSKIDYTPYIEELKNEENRKQGIEEEKPSSDIIVERKKVEKAEQPIITPKAKAVEIELDIKNQPSLELNGEGRNSATKKVARQPVTTISSTQVSTQSSVANKELTKSKLQSKTKIRKNQEEDSEEKSKVKIVFILVASLTVFAYMGGDLTESILGFNLQKILHGDSSRAPTSVSTAIKDKNSNGQGKLSFTGHDVSMDLFIDNKKADYIGTHINVPLGQKIRIEVKKAGYKSFVKSIELTEANYSALVEIPKLDRQSVGLLSTSQNYPAGSKLVFEIDGETIEKNLPFKEEQFPVGVYEAKVINNLIGSEKKIRIEIEENKVHYLE